MLFTIGHSNHALQVFIGLLRRHGIAIIADVRTAPWSRHVPHFNKKPLARALEQVNVQYVFMGEALGGKTKDPAFLNDKGNPDWAKLSGRKSFQEGVNRLMEIGHRQKTAILCAEENPDRCHRRHLITRVLVERGIEVNHIRGDGSLLPEFELRNAESKGQLPLFK